RQLAPAGTTQGVGSSASPGLATAASSTSNEMGERETRGERPSRLTPWWALWNEEGDPLPMKEGKVIPVVNEKPLSPMVAPQNEEQEEQKEEETTEQGEAVRDAILHDETLPSLVPSAVDSCFGIPLPALAVTLPAIALTRELHRRPRVRRRFQ